MSVQTDVLTSWNAGAARQAVVEFVERTVSDGVPAEERIAVFDNDGTLWCEKPMPIQADFILRRLYEMALADPQLRDRQPWKAAYTRDYAWLGKVLAEHYAEGRVRAISAGSEPGDHINPTVVQVLTERGLDTAAETPKMLDYDTVRGADVVITMGCGETCPVAPGKRYEDWVIDDPKDQDLETVRRIVADIDARVQTLLAELTS